VRSAPTVFTTADAPIGLAESIGAEKVAPEAVVMPKVRSAPAVIHAVSARPSPSTSTTSLLAAPSGIPPSVAGQPSPTPVLGAGSPVALADGAGVVAGSEAAALVVADGAGADDVAPPPPSSSELQPARSRPAAVSAAVTARDLRCTADPGR
jgi:hypothetical protein